MKGNENGRGGKNQMGAKEIRGKNKKNKNKAIHLKW